MALTRKMLKDMGLEPDAIESIMEAHGASMSAMVSRSDRDEAIQKALDEQRAEFEKNKPAVIKPTETTEYKELLGKYNGLSLDMKLRDYKVKPKYTAFVKEKLNPDDFDKSIENVKKEYAEFFEAEPQKEPEQPKEPQKASPSFATSGSPDTKKSEEQKVYEAFSKAFAN